MRFFHCSYALGILAVGLIPVESQAQEAAKHDSIGRAASPRRVETKVSQDSARSVALARVPNGRVAAVQLKVEHGTLVYIYDIAVPGRNGLVELQVSAVDGQIVSVEQLGGPEGQTNQAGQPGQRVADRPLTPGPPRE